MKLKSICISLNTILFLTACGGGGSGGTSTTNNIRANEMTVYMDSGYNAQGVANREYVTVHICQPGSTTLCQDVDHVILDTGSTGLRIFESFISPSISLPVVQASDGIGSPLTQCMYFNGGVDYGSLHYADVYLAGEYAPQVQVQIMNDPLYTIYPSNCPVETQYNPQSGAKGVLGVGAKKTTNQSSLYACATPQTCVLTTNNYNYPLNPVAQFVGNDNNGVIVSMGSVPASGTTSMTGKLIFGIGTQANNQLPANATLLYSNESVPNCEFSLSFNGSNYSSMFDTGTPFTASQLGSVPNCSSYPNFYCPDNTTLFSATLYSYNSFSGPSINFTSPVLNYQTYINALGFPTWILPNFIIVPNQLNGNMIIGMSQLYGKTIYVAIDHQPTPYGTGPFWSIQDNND